MNENQMIPDFMLRKVAWVRLIAKQTAKQFTAQALHHHWVDCLHWQRPRRSLANISS